MTAKALVNGELVDLTSEQLQEVQATQISPEETAAADRKRRVDNEVSGRILAVAPLHTQQNLSSHRIDMMSRRMAGESISAEDAALEARAIEVAKKIAAIRAAGKAAVAAGTDPNEVVWPD